MQVVGTQVIPEMGGKLGFTVEFVGDGGEVVSVVLRNDETQSVNLRNAVELAKAVMLEMAAAKAGDLNSDGPRARLSARAAGDRNAIEEQLDEGRHISGERSGFGNRLHDIEGAGKTLRGQRRRSFHLLRCGSRVAIKAKKNAGAAGVPGTFLPPIC